ncbi:MAG: amylo-alpha-1,6-glucosidase [Cyanobacteria bacterium J06598_1]
MATSNNTSPPRDSLPTSISFGRDICSDPIQSTQREWLITNGIGGYGCGTLSGILTRCYHGFLVAALKPPLERTLLLSKLDETAHYLGKPYPLSCDRWSGGTTTGHGYRNTESFHLEGTTPTWTYTCADARLQKRIWMQPQENTTYTQYKLCHASDRFTLAVKVLVNHRNHHHTTQSDHGPKPWEFSTRNHPRGLKVTAAGCPTPFYIFTTRGQFQPISRWYQHYVLTQEQYRGLTSLDDHFHCATLRTHLTPGDTLTIAASTEPFPNLDETAALTARQQYERNLLSKAFYPQSISPTSLPNSSSPRPTHNPQTPWWLSAAEAQWLSAAEARWPDAAVGAASPQEIAQQLILAADQFIATRTTPDPETQQTTAGKTIIAGYPWFGDWGRDTMIALPGLTLATGRPEVARPILRTFSKYLSQGMLPNAFPEAGDTPGYNTVDAILWYFEAIRAYVTATQDHELLEELFPALEDVIDWHLRGTRYNIHLDQTDGLLYAGTETEQLTWMDAKVDDWVVTPRIGKPVEINALWHNALLCMVDFCDRIQKPKADYLALAQFAATSFPKFWNPKLNHCYDVIDGPTGHDSALRPNQLFAVSLTYAPPLQQQQQKSIVDSCAQQLLTSHGLRSLAQSHPSYTGTYGGDRIKRDGSYHQGTTWSWLIGPFVQAHLKVYKAPAIARQFLTPLTHHLSGGCVGTLSEIFDGDPPFISRGAFAQAWSVAEVLRTYQLIEQAEEQFKNQAPKSP